MRIQRGQSAVEFALIAPLIFLMIFGMIWGGIMFMEFMHYSNAVRTAARVVSVSDSTDREQVIADQKTWLEELYEKEVSVKFYKPTVDIQIEKDTDGNPQDAVVNVAFYMEDSEYYSLPYILRAVEFPPRTIKTLNYRMKLENTTTTASTTS